jgi:hypothetical protein
MSSIAPGAYRDLNAIMSGIVTTKRYLEVLGPGAFCVRTRLYGVDTMFMCAHAKAGGVTVACASEVIHALSRDAPGPLADRMRRSWLEAKGVFWTVLTYHRPWAILLPAYIPYFMMRRALGAVRRHRPT